MYLPENAHEMSNANTITKYELYTVLTVVHIDDSIFGKPTNNFIYGSIGWRTYKNARFA